MKKCTVCKQEKELSEFSQNLKKSDGLNYECKECQKEYFRQYYDQNKQKHKSRVKKINNSKRLYLSKYKLEKGCCRCGYNRNPAALQFHHIDSNDKKFNLARNFKLSEEDLQAEIKKCIVLCANCHFEEHNPFDLSMLELYEIRPTKKRSGIKVLSEKNVCGCGGEKYRESKKCKKCIIHQAEKNKQKHNKIPKSPRYDIEELKQLVWQIPSTKIAEKYGVSDKAVDKWCKKHNIDKPPRGYWTKFNRNKNEHTNT